MNIAAMIDKTREFLRTGVWQVRLKELPRTRAMAYRSLRIALLSYRGFGEDRCPLRASALTFYSLLSVVPVAAMLFGIAKGFGFQKKLETQLFEQFPEHQEVVSRIVEFSQSFLETTQGGLIAGVGVIMLFWTVISVLGNIEHSFNDIWKIHESRTILRKFTDYLAIMLIGPVNLILSSSATVLIKAQVSELGDKLGLSEVIGPMLSAFLHVLPWVLIWILFAFIYIVMPNTQVKLKSGIIAAVLAGSVYQVTQLVFVEFQLGVARYNAIYGGFAALPLFLVWLQLSWVIVLLGAEVAYAVQHVDSYEFAPLVRKLSPGRKRLLSVYVAHAAVKKFAEGGQPLTSPQLANQLGMPIVLVRSVVADLVGANILSRTVSEKIKESAYQPASDISRFTIAYVLEHLDNAGSDEIPATESDHLDSLTRSIERFEETLRKSPENRLLNEL